MGISVLKTIFVFAKPSLINITIDMMFYKEQIRAYYIFLLSLFLPALFENGN